MIIKNKKNKNMAENNLQLYRNKIFFDSKENAKNALISQLQTSSDGEIVLSRYVDGDQVKTLFGFASVSEELEHYYDIYDYEDFFDKNKLSDVVINSVKGVWSESGTTVTVLLASDNIQVSSGYSAVVYPQLDDVVFDAIATDDTLDSAYNKIENNLVKLINEVKTIESSGRLTIEGSDTITVTDIKGEDEVVTGKKISVTENLDLDCGDYA